MAMRLLLTMVALLAGLVVQLSPAQARVRAAGASEIGAVSAESRGERAADSRAVAAARPADGSWRESHGFAAMAVGDVAHARPVIVGVDRAHE
jgi:hypothetical protein